MRDLPLSPLEDATLRYVLAHSNEGGGWLDLTRVCSQTGRMLPEVRETVMRLARRRLLRLDEGAAHTPRWMRFEVPEGARPSPGRQPRAPTP
jgi:hypothetical protein